MLAWFIESRLKAAEVATGEPLDFVRFIARASLGALLTWKKLADVAPYRRALPAPAFHVVRVVAVKHEDCGPCVQTVINYAQKDGVPADVLRAALRADFDALPADLADVARFTKAVVAVDGPDDALRDRLRARWGDEALVEIAIAISACRVFPVTKRVLGFARSCAVTGVTDP